MFAGPIHCACWTGGHCYTSVPPAATHPLGSFGFLSIREGAVTRGEDTASSCGRESGGRIQDVGVGSLEGRASSLPTPSSGVGGASAAGATLVDLQHFIAVGGLESSAILRVKLFVQLFPCYVEPSVGIFGCFIPADIRIGMAQPNDTDASTEDLKQGELEGCCSGRQRQGSIIASAVSEARWLATEVNGGP